MGLNNYFKTLSKEAKDKIAVALSEVQEDAVEETAEETTEEVVEETQKFVEATLANGTVVSIEPNLEVGAMVTAEVEGEVVAAPDGQHELEDGTVITTEGGSIVEIMPAEGEQEEDAEMAEEVAPVEEARQPKKVITREEIESIFSEQFEAVKAEKDAEINDLKNELNKLSEAFNVIVDGLGNMPSEEPTVKPKANFGKVSRAKAIVERLNKHKK
jgi:hypothetical protein